MPAPLAAPGPQVGSSPPGFRSCLCQVQLHGPLKPDPNRSPELNPPPPNRLRLGPNCPTDRFFVARIAGVDIPRDKRIEIALTYVYGIGLTRAQKIIAKSGVNPDIRVKDLEDGDVQKLRAAVESFTLEGDLRRQEGMALKRLQDIGCVRGRRHRAGLPVRGQRTRTNARTRRGARKTVAGKKK